MAKTVTMYTHPTCSTCKGVLKQLQTWGYMVTRIDIRQTPPDKAFFMAQLTEGVSVKKLLNTSGQLYKDLGLKETIETLSQEEIAALLATHGMLVKRPIVIAGQQVTFGTRDIETVWGE